MLSNKQIKQITALKFKKYREESGQFTAEGHKLVLDLIHSEFIIPEIYANSAWIFDNREEVEEKGIPLFEISPYEMERISALSNPSPVLAVVKMREPDPAALRYQALINSPTYQLTRSLSLALDDIRDPGNLGTIIRLADWFGINTVFCSLSSVDLYNPKVVQATMGSIARVKVIYTELENLLKEVSGEMPVYGALLEGENLYNQNLTSHGLLLIGNESRGISNRLLPFITRKISIPFYGRMDQGKAESLNASMAASIICAEFRRQMKIS